MDGIDRGAGGDSEPDKVIEVTQSEQQIQNQDKQIKKKHEQFCETITKDLPFMSSESHEKRKRAEL